MAHLPLEVVESIFEYLTSVEDLKSACLVCHQWYLAFQNKRFRQKELVVITADKQFQYLAQMENRHRMYYHFFMKDIDITESSLPFWKRYGGCIKSLKVHGCYIREKMFVAAMSQCKKLEHLTLHDCKELLMSGLTLEAESDGRLLESAWTNMKSLTLSSNRYLSDAILLKLVTLCPKLESLVLTGCPVSYHIGMVRKFYPNDIITPSESVITFKAIHSFIKRNAPHIKHLSLSETFMDNNSLQTLAQTEGLDLSVLNLRLCCQISNTGVLYFCNSLTLITELDVSFCSRLTDTGLITICSSLPLLKKLFLQGCRGITDVSVANVCQLGRLEALNLSECEILQGGGILKGLCHRVNPNFFELWVANLPLISEAVVLALANSLPGLIHLDLANCRQAVTDITVQAIFKHCTKLRFLDLSMCDDISDSGFTGMGVDGTNELKLKQMGENLMHLPLGNKAEVEIVQETRISSIVIKFTEKAILKAPFSGISICRLHGLRSLRLSGCRSLSDISLKYAFKFNELRVLDLSNCPFVTSDGIKYLARNNTAIEMLNLDDCGKVDDSGVSYIVQYLTRLRSLVLGSNKITNSIAGMIMNNSLMLNYIDLRHCGQITESGVGHLFLSLPFLRTFHHPVSKAELLAYIPPAPKGLRWLRRT